MPGQAPCARYKTREGRASSTPRRLFLVAGNDVEAATPISATATPAWYDCSRRLKKRRRRVVGPGQRRQRDRGVLERQRRLRRDAAEELRADPPRARTELPPTRTYVNANVCRVPHRIDQQHTTSAANAAATREREPVAVASPAYPHSPRDDRDRSRTARPASSASGTTNGRRTLCGPTDTCVTG